VIKTYLLAFATIFAATSGLATGGIYCDGISEDSVSAYLTVGRVPGFAVVDTQIVAAGRAWSMSAQDSSEQIVLVQGAIAGEFIVADFADANVEEVVASLRLVRIESAFGAIASGVLSIPSVGAWPVVCESE